eukprot:4761669-Pleurochrysis_carterae.AAC.1
MLIAELDVHVAMNAPVSQEDTAVALIKRMKHAFEVPRLLHDPGLASAMRTVPLDFNCSSTEQLQEFDDLCRYMAERHLSQYVSSTRANSCESFSGFAEAHEVTAAFIRLIVAAIERYLEPEDFAADPYGSSDS